ncbi:DNA cytosine methyltransferase [Roseofilum sp. BLCC_M91]|uniref:DNA cytosine methyltransferase n=1 Tax=Roseofilum halophilum BLCC-M91 TaxID=3022259 RepID=A0ABT7BNJ4_9CYAN|nr:DNA cytosine methyltransferase [Roseofilum halophilum]MDJ1180767.1 DNA cytosine methyltransferase [Roseofilum halophilum BLCC-M91]
MRDYIATICFDCQDPKRYKQEFIKRVYQRQKYQPISAQDYARLQGFPEWFQLAQRESTAKKQLGNAVSVPVVYYLAQSLVKVLF